MNCLRKKSLDTLINGSNSGHYDNMSDGDNFSKNHKNLRGTGQIDFKKQYGGFQTSTGKRSKNQNSCANINCSNLKKVRRKFQNKNNFYCLDCARIIDKHEYCHVCYEISSSIPKDWVSCDYCNRWVHQDCDET